LLIVPVQPRTCTPHTLYAKPSSRRVAELTTDWQPEYVPDHVRKIINSSLVNAQSTSIPKDAYSQTSWRYTYS